LRAWWCSFSAISPGRSPVSSSPEKREQRPPPPNPKPQPPVPRLVHSQSHPRCGDGHARVGSDPDTR
jgi:hypothetical protein